MIKQAFWLTLFLIGISNAPSLAENANPARNLSCEMIDLSSISPPMVAPAASKGDIVEVQLLDGSILVDGSAYSVDSPTANDRFVTAILEKSESNLPVAVRAKQETEYGPSFSFGVVIYDTVQNELWQTHTFRLPGGLGELFGKQTLGISSSTAAYLCTPRA